MEDLASQKGKNTHPSAKFILYLTFCPCFNNSVKLYTILLYKFVLIDSELRTKGKNIEAKY